VAFIASSTTGARAFYVQGWYFRSLRHDCVKLTALTEWHRKKHRGGQNTALEVFYRSSLHGAGGDSRHFCKLAKAPSDGLAS
ncbi:MAG: hypothetical protein RSG92_12225, partial [Pseudomonas sp.]